MVKKIANLLERLNEWIQTLSAILLSIMTILVLAQIFFRYILGNPLGETQELSIYAMVWVIMLGSTIAVRNKTHIAVNYFVELLPQKLANSVNMLCYLLTLIFFSILVKQGWALMLRAMLQQSPSTGLPVGYVVASIPFCAAISILYILEQMICKKEVSARTE